MGDPAAPAPAPASMAAAPAPAVDLFTGLTTTRAIRRYTDEPVPPEVLRDLLFAATRAPSGSNRQPVRFLVLADGPNARQAKRLLGESAREVWRTKRVTDRYADAPGSPDATGSPGAAGTAGPTGKAGATGTPPDSPRTRMDRTMREYVDHFEAVPVVVLPCYLRYREPNLLDGASVYPACQNLLLAARARGYGGVLTGFHVPVRERLRSLLRIPAGVEIAATITLGRPRGSHGPVRRRPLAELVYADGWEQPADWAVDPPDTRHTAWRS